MYLDKWDSNLLSKNDSIHWTEELIEKYKDKLNWHYLILNKALPWSIPFIKHYKSNLDWNLIEDEQIIKEDELYVFFQSIWEKAFQPYIDDAMIEEIMERIQ